MTIDRLSDDALLYVFHFYLAEASEVEAWHTLVHVHRRWRTLVFASPRHLNLRITCTNNTPASERLDIWPALPIVISGSCNTEMHTYNLLDALEHHDRVCQIELSLEWELDTIFEALERPFPELTVLKLHSIEEYDPVYTYSGQCLGGTTHLRSLSLAGIPFPGLPNLLLSSTDLVDLRLMKMPISFFISFDEIVTALSALTRFQVLHLGFYEFHPDWENRSSPSPTRTVLPSLIELRCEGVTEYLEEFTARIDAPLLERLDIFTSLLLDGVLNTPQIRRFISHVPKLQALDEAHIGIDIDNSKAWINFLSTRTSSGVLKLGVSCTDPERQFPCLAQFCRSPFFPLPTLETLYIDRGTYSTQLWLDIFRPFTSVKNLYLYKDVAPRIAPALEVIGEIVTVLPALENVFIEKFRSYGLLDEGFSNVAAKRQVSGHPIVISDWDRTGREEGH